ncbi:MAG: AAA domain-containing protein, partial [Actinoplanes sp.]
ASADALAARFTADADRLERRQQEIGRAAARLGLPGVVTFADLGRVVAVAELGARRNRPEPFWFGAGVLAAASGAVASLRRAVEAVTVAEGQARRWFHPSVVDQPVEELADRLTHVHRGWRKLLRPYRRDWEIAASFALPAVAPDEAVANLGAAVAWKQARRELAVAERRHAPVLGRYWQRDRTDHAAVQEALQAAGEVLRMTPPEALPAVVEHVCRPAPDAALLRLAADARATVEQWQATPEIAGRPELGHGTIRDAVAWLRAQAGPATAAAELLRAYRRSTGLDLDVAAVDRIAGLRRTLAEAETALAATVDAGRELLGPDPDPDALAWARITRRAAAGADRPLTGAQVAALAGTRGPGDLAGRAATWFAARDALPPAFAESRRGALIAELSAYDTAKDLIDALRADAGGQEDWFGHRDARRTLAGYGLTAAVDFCADQQIAPALIVPVLERAALCGWADAVLRADSRLHPLGAEDRDRLVAEFRRLDEDLVSDAPGRIVAALRSRRAAGVVAEQAELLRREGLKETRHLAVRDLIDQARDTVLAVKPCFLMSPLAVSQFLPPDLRFDVVIFDEASQVTPADAINCIYRGDALITAGDDRQLPPTSFFERGSGPDEEPDGDPATDVDDFASVLELAKACGAFRSLGLTWHYRSRHEGLIAFANHTFYDGRLTTFPDADPAGPDAGVELIPAEGVYRRGTARDNPIEAEKVAERIVHSFTTRPELSLGVVTFSVAQAEAIEAALERAAGRHPGLETFLDGDRLHGFFVKSLESVQGDERDVMIFSIGYGFDEDGRISANFGALTRPNGWRRLNVAITRARRRVEIVSSVRARDIPDSGHESVRRLAAYLDFAERGTVALALPAGPAPAGPGTLARSVADTVRSWGYDVRAGAGAGGYRIDLAVRHPAHPAEAYVLGIECDGPMYRSAPAARDRDRLRAQVLHGLGWTLHRVWSTAWHRERAEEEARLRAAIERAMAASGGDLPAGRARTAGARFL